MTTARGAHGTPPYTSPEQTSGEPSYESDVYSFGVTLFQLITGELPFQARNKVKMAHLHATAVRPSLIAINSACPYWLDVLVRACMSLKSGDRPTVETILKTIRTKEVITSASQKLPSIAIHPSVKLSDGDRLGLLQRTVIHDWKEEKTYDFVLVECAFVHQIITLPRSKILTITDPYCSYAQIAKLAKVRNAEMLFKLSVETLFEKMDL